ncbi:acVLRF1 family peptidyl-tRNA hydrolase [Microlunatus soli]|uniref:Actinobacteria/chloroflexi VLRF1 release factor domain-containing protein n=1 Tax=Microlunatus soli TaxID=630515 RepID=A0A1H1REC8_9ACTN|nr:acVLRF1 family peptidyl-tRNA hydrolase [Microlunatus soli]SDS34023.1 hypothetical protein SAMN04489812_1616 [Microlunatus soli]
MARMISIDRHRLPRWLDNFGSRHGSVTATAEQGAVLFQAVDGAEARVRVPFGPLAPDIGDPTARLLDHVAADRLIGAVLVRRGGFAVGVFDGDSLSSSKTGSGYVQGRTKAGGWSQQRYARRRSNQAQQLYGKASAVVESILLPVVDDLVAVVGGGDRAGVVAALEPSVLAPVRQLLLPTIHPTDDPRRRVLEDFPARFLAVEIELNDLA